jgi:hypothetical protein
MRSQMLRQGQIDAPIAQGFAFVAPARARGNTRCISSSRASATEAKNKLAARQSALAGALPAAVRWSQLAALGVGLALTASRARAQAEPQAAPPAESSLPSEAAPPVEALPPRAATPAPEPEDSATPQPPAAGPQIELPPEAATPEAPPLVQLGTPIDREQALTRGLTPERMAQPTTVVGGYGQFTLNSLRVGPDKDNDFHTRANLRRIVLFVAHPITDTIRVYSEFEWENALACDNCNGSAEVEQAFIEWQLLGDSLALRAGLVLIPMGIINEWHEPPVFHGVDRPQVDTLVIPTTWRELGLGITGKLGEIWHYQLYFTTTLDPLRLDSSGLSPALTFGSVAPADAFAVTGRMEVEPVLGVIGGVSFFASDLGGNADYFRRNGGKRDLKLPLIGYALDARMRRYGIEARLVWAQFFFPNAADLIGSFREDGSPLFPNIDTTGPIPDRIQGGYVEVAYDVFHELHLGHELLPFVRLEMYDTQAGVPKGYRAEPLLDVQELTMGLTYRPIPQLAFKADVQLRDRRYGLDELQVNAGFGYMF